MPKTGIVISGLVLAALLGMSCTDKTTVIQSTSGVTVQGEVHIWRCGIFDCVNNYCREDMRFGARTNGDSAKVSFVRLNGLSHSFFTDDSSSFTKILDDGAYIIVVESRWTEPDTIYNVYLQGDTAIRVDLMFDYLHPTDLSISFWYPDGDSLGADAEWDYIRRLNGYIQKLNISGVDPPTDLLELREVSSFYGGAVGAYWRISVGSPPIHIGDAIRHSHDILRLYPDRFPEGLEVHQYFAYICLDSRQPYDVRLSAWQSDMAHKHNAGGVKLIKR